MEVLKITNNFPNKHNISDKLFSSLDYLKKGNLKSSHTKGKVKKKLDNEEDQDTVNKIYT